MAFYNLTSFKPPVYRPPVIPNPMDVPNVEPDQPVYASEADYQMRSAHSPAQFSSSPADQTPDPNAGTVMTDSGVEVDGGMNLKALRDFAKMVYPDTEAPQMEYGSDVNIKIPWTKRSLFKMSGKKMDKLAGALAAAAQGAYVPGSDSGGQFLKGFLQGYGGVRAQDYAERKKEYETQKAASKANLEARSKLIGQLGLEGYKALMKPAAAGPHGYITLTQEMVDRVKKATGKVIDPGLVGQDVPVSMLAGTPEGTNYQEMTYRLGRDRMNVDAAKDWRNSDFYKAHLGLSRATSSIIALSKDPKNLSDKAIIFFINKVLDANSAVLAGEQKSWGEGSNFIERLKGDVLAIKNKGRFSSDDRDQLVSIAKQLHAASKRLFDAERANTIKTNSEFGISPNAYQGIDYTPKDYKDYESSSGTSAATSTSRSVDAALGGQ